MTTARLKRLQAAGWKTGNAKDFLRLSDEEAMLVELKLSFSDAVRRSRQRRGLSRVDLAQRMGSSPSRVAKLETGDPSVSLDLIVRAFFASGGTRQELLRALGSNFLNVSRAHLVGLLESLELPYRKVGSHRRILFKDLMAYQRASRVERKKALDELASQAQELGLGY